MGRYTVLTYSFIYLVAFYSEISIDNLFSVFLFLGVFRIYPFSNINKCADERYMSYLLRCINVWLVAMHFSLSRTHNISEHSGDVIIELPPDVQTSNIVI